MSFKLSFLAPNWELADLFLRLAGYLEASLNFRKAREMMSAAALVHNWPDRIILLSDIPKLQCSLAARQVVADQIRGIKCEELTDLEDEWPERAEIVNSLTYWCGISSIDAHRYYNLGLWTVMDIVKMLERRSPLRLLLDWREDISAEMSKAEFTNTLERIRNALTQIELVWWLVDRAWEGDVRTGQLVLLVKDTDLRPIKDALAENIIVVIEERSDAILCLARFGEGVRRLDVRVTEDESWIPMCLHWAGSGRFNVLLSKKAEEQGIYLGMNRVEDLNTHKRLWFADETSLFAALDVDFVPVADRISTLTELK